MLGNKNKELINLFDCVLIAQIVQSKFTLLKHF